MIVQHMTTENVNQSTLRLRQFLHEPGHLVAGDHADRVCADVAALPQNVTHDVKTDEESDRGERTKRPSVKSQLAFLSQLREKLR